MNDCERLRMHLRQGDFTALLPFFTADGEPEAPVVRLHRARCFAEDLPLLAEALTCACFLGAIDVAEYLLAEGVQPSGGQATGLNAIHWAANRGQLAAVELLLRHAVPLETRNAYGGTVLGGTVWAAMHEPRPMLLPVIEALLLAGALVHAAEYPSGLPTVDALLERFGARGA